MSWYHRRYHYISIHAPARGATQSLRIRSSRSRNFNPRSREGSDLCVGVPLTILFGFQSTLPRGERQLLSQIGRCTWVFQSTLPRGERRFTFAEQTHKSDFNPRSREGSDQASSRANIVTGISIHAPARGATIASIRWTTVNTFQSTLPRGERLLTPESAV